MLSWSSSFTIPSSEQQVSGLHLAMHSAQHSQHAACSPSFPSAWPGVDIALCEHIAAVLNCPKSSRVVASVYFWRVHDQLPLLSHTAGFAVALPQVVMLCHLLAMKFVEDENPSNRQTAHALGLGLENMLRIERALLVALGYSLGVSPDTFAHFAQLQEHNKPLQQSAQGVWGHDARLEPLVHSRTHFESLPGGAVWGVANLPNPLAMDSNNNNKMMSSSVGSNPFDFAADFFSSNNINNSCCNLKLQPPVVSNKQQDVQPAVDVPASPCDMDCIDNDDDSWMAFVNFDQVDM